MKVFLDSNVFLYSFLNQDVAKKATAAKILAQAIWDGNGYVSLQVAKEFCNVMLKKSRKSIGEIATALAILRKFNMVEGSLDLVQRALEIRERCVIQFYDSLVLAAAEAGGCDVVLTEDLNDGQTYFGVKAVNPFK